MFGPTAICYEFLVGMIERDIQELQDKVNELSKKGYVIRETKTFGALGEKILIILYKD